MKTTLYTTKTGQFKAVYDRYCNQGAWDLRAFAWFLSIRLPNNKWEFVGIFRTKKELEKDIGF